MRGLKDGPLALFISKDLGMTTSYGEWYSVFMLASPLVLTVSLFTGSDTRVVLAEQRKNSEPK